MKVLADRETGEGLREIRVHSPALGREVSLAVRTPPGWRPGDHGRHPVLYLLHGSSDDHTCWRRHTDLLRLAAGSGLLVVMPDGGRLGFYTDWRVPDRAGTVPHWETFHLDEVRTLLEQRFGAGELRLAAGISMGGYGALRYAMRRPGMFRAVASLSGLVHLTRPGMGALLGLLSVREGIPPGRIWGPRRRAFATWAANDPCRHAEAFRGTEVLLAAGDGTRVPGEETVPGMGLIERTARAANEEFAERLRTAGVDVTTHFTAGTHFWGTWRAHLAALWPRLTAPPESA
ncbi:alpha/beta hydrolase [Amycolatopsis rhizosphaerae]|uniref:alpha/beta hydrolase n=1 Tax=Amycolatopsis rhizosphaerae TaxID=2053003 RepID=UPI001643F0C2|nr:alpha/beta hydrolase family protein [Amycolatopsis rhizosphaerae]